MAIAVLVGWSGLVTSSHFGPFSFAGVKEEARVPGPGDQRHVCPAGCGEDQGKRRRRRTHRHGQGGGDRNRVRCRGMMQVSKKNILLIRTCFCNRNVLLSEAIKKLLLFFKEREKTVVIKRSVLIPVFLQTEPSSAIRTLVGCRDFAKKLYGWIP